jgi:hypothetical protein
VINEWKHQEKDPKLRKYALFMTRYRTLHKALGNPSSLAEYKYRKLAQSLVTPKRSFEEFRRREFRLDRN